VLGAAGVNAANLKLPPFARVFLFSEHFHLALHAGSIIEIVLALAALTTLASLYPAYRAARLKPVTAMYHVG
jgi:putative ABC transport system permease protein